MKNVLIVDNDSFLRHAFAGLIKSQSGFFSAYSAGNATTAIELVETGSFQIVIVGVNLSELEVYELVTHMAKHQPQIRVILFTGSASSLLRTQIRQLTNTVHFDHTRDFGQLTRRLFTELRIDFGGRVHGCSISSFLQMMELERRSCTLHISAKGQTGFLYLTEGEPVAASLPPLSGKVAALAILAWKNVTIDIDYTPPDRMREFREPLMNLLLEAGRQDDEKNSRRFNQRCYDRFECRVAADYEVSSGNWPCFLRDISLGGAYLETEHHPLVGSELILILAVPTLELSCKVPGKVVRRDEKGIGVCFENLSLKHKEAIQALSALHLSPAAVLQPDEAEEPSLELFG